jgi:hypothetical protein
MSKGCAFVFYIILFSYLLLAGQCRGFQGWWAVERFRFFFFASVILISILPKWFSWGFFVLVLCGLVIPIVSFSFPILCLDFAMCWLSSHLSSLYISLCVCVCFFSSFPFSPPLNVHYATRTIFRLWFYFLCVPFKPDSFFSGQPFPRSIWFLVSIL